MEYTLDQAQELFEQEKYAEAVKIALEIAKDGEEKKDALFLAASCFLTLANDTKDEMMKKYESLVTNAFDYVQTWDEYLEGVQHYENELCAWSKQQQMNLVEYYAENFDEEGMYAAVPISEERSKLVTQLAFMSVLIKWKPNIIRIACEKAGATEEQIEADLAKLQAPNLPLTERRSELAFKAFSDVKIQNTSARDEREVDDFLFKTALRVFNETYDDIMENNCITRVYFDAVKDRWFNGILTPETDMESAMPKAGDEPKNKRADCLFEILMMYIKQLQLTLTVNGVTANFLAGNEERTKTVEKIRKTYAELQKINPNLQLSSVEELLNPPAPTKKSGCYVATAVYGSYDCPQVWTLRRYRDDVLGKTWYGRAFIRCYYAVSPTLVKWFGKTKWFKRLWRGQLDKMVRRLNEKGYLNTQYMDKSW